MNVIFLDIDGVMNSEMFYRERHKKRWFKLQTYIWWIVSKIKYIFNGFKHKSYSLANYKINPKHYEFDYVFKRLKKETDKLKWKWLSEFCNKNDYKICISSVWKNNFKEINEWNDALIKLGFNDGIFIGITGNRQTLRGTEIKEWVNNHKDTKNYVILDDDNDMLPEQLFTCYFQVDNWYGLTPNHLYRINKYFLKCDEKI
jgi:hypothetical protein